MDSINNDCVKLTTCIILFVASILAAFIKPDQKNRFFSTVYTFILILSLTFSILLALISDNLTRESLEYFLACTLAVLSSIAAGGFLSQVAQSFLKDFVKPKEPTKINGDFSGHSFNAVLTKEKDGDGVYGGGMVIGFLERASITLLLITGLHSSLPIIFAIKGLARYSEIKSGILTAERFIIGTLASSLWASLCALIPFLLAN